MKDLRNKVKMLFWNYLFSSSFGMISIEGSLNTSLLAILLSKVSNKDGSSNKFETMANKSVMETNPPKAMVPPKLETVKTKNPKNSTIEV